MVDVALFFRHTAYGSLPTPGWGAIRGGGVPVAVGDCRVISQPRRHDLSGMWQEYSAFMLTSSHLIAGNYQGRELT